MYFVLLNQFVVTLALDRNVTLSVALLLTKKRKLKKGFSSLENLFQS